MTVDLVVGADGLLLSVRDDGAGLRSSPLAAGTGTRSMQELAARVGGEWAIGPGPAGGVVVTLRIPAGTKERIAG